MEKTNKWLQHRWKLAGGLLLLLAIGIWLYVERDELSREKLIAFGKSLPAAGFLAAFLVLPLVGFPITPFLFIAGVRFGFWGGMAISALCVPAHNYLAFKMVHGRFRERVIRRLKKSGYSMPTPTRHNRIWFTAVFAAIHGPPYAIKLYGLALTDIPFRVYFWVGMPVYYVFCVIPVVAGSSAAAVNPLWLYGGIVALIGMAVGVRWLTKRVGVKS